MSDTELPLPVNIDSTYADTDDATSKHQKHHDVLHAEVNYHMDSATDDDDKHGDRAYADTAISAAIETALEPLAENLFWDGDTFVPLVNPKTYTSPASVDPRLQPGVTIADGDRWYRLPG